MHLEGARGPQHPDHRACRCPPDDRIVHYHQALALDAVAQRVQLHTDRRSAHCLCRGNEGSTYVPVLDQSLAVRDATRPGIALRSRHARLRHPHDQVGLHRSLGGQHLAHANPGVVDAPAVQDSVRAGEVDELEEAELRVHHVVIEGPHRPATCLVDHHDLAGIQFADHVGADHIQGR